MALEGVANLARLPELKRRLLWTFALLAVYRIGIHIPVPGVNTEALQELFKNMKNTLVGIFDMFSGGGLSNLSILALGIMPYISASIIMQLLTVVSPELKRLYKEEGAAGRKKMTQYTRYLTVLICVIQAMGIAIGLETATGPNNEPLIMAGGWGFRLVTVVTLCGGTIFVMWLGEQITERGLGNGISLIIFAGIVAGIPGGLMNTFRLMTDGGMTLFLVLIMLIVMAAILAFIIFMERGQRRVPVQYAKRVVGRRMMGGQSTHLPLKVNTAGVIPPIFASSILMFPATIATFSGVEWLQSASATWFSPNGLLYNVIYVALIIFFCYFYTAVIFDPKDIAENLKNHGGFVPGIRPGSKTKEYIDGVLTRITLWGSLYISLVCLVPMFMHVFFNVPFYYGGTGLLIVVGVSMDFMGQIESHLISRQYDGLLKKGRIKGR